ncbi:MAG: glycosyltransferase family 2 protein [Gammaproteobacteria bacterium]
MMTATEVETPTQSQGIVSIGVPVYNGARFLDACLKSLTSQTYRDLDIVVCDNASTDGTSEIGLKWAAKDPRVRYYRSPENRGAARNFNWALELARGEFFRWCASDDACAPECVERCVEVLNKDMSLVLCSTQVTDIDVNGNFLRFKQSGPLAGAKRPSERFGELMDMSHTCEQVFGLIRMANLRRTRGIAAYSDSDRVLLAELALHGRFFEIPQSLFLHRLHEGSSVEQYPDRRERTKWFDTNASTAWVFPYFRQLVEYGYAIHRSGVKGGEKLRCIGMLFSWSWYHRELLLGDVICNIKSGLKRRAPWVAAAWRLLRKGLARS